MLGTIAFASSHTAIISSRVRTAEAIVTESVVPDELLSPWCVPSLEFSTDDMSSCRPDSLSGDWSQGVEKVDDLDGVMDLCLMSSLNSMVISPWIN